MGRAVASAFEKTPEANAKIIWGKVYIKDTVDVYYQVDIEDGKDLSGVVIPDTGNKSIVEVCKELRQSARRLRSGEDDQYEKTQKGLLSRLPAWLLRIILFLLTFMEYNLGYTAKFLGAQPEPFGTVMVTNVGPFGIDIAYAPLVPPSRVPFIVLLGGLEERAWVSNGKVCIRPTICGNATIDHRILDGNKIGRLGKTIRAYMEDPYLFETSLGLESPWEGLDPPEGHPYCNFPHIEEAAES